MHYQPGTPARLFLADDRHGYSSVVLGVYDGRLLLAPVEPAHGNLILERLMGSVRLELTVGGLPFGATTNVCSVNGEGILVALPDELKRIQRRQYFRMPAPPGTTASVELPDGVRLRELVDISGGGCAFIGRGGDEDLTDGIAVTEVCVPLGQERLFVGHGVIRRLARQDGARGGDMVMGLEFGGLPPSGHRQLIKWVTDTQRAELRAHSLDTTWVKADVMVLLHQAANLVGFHHCAGLSHRAVRIEVSGDEPAMFQGVAIPQIDLYVAGQQLLRCAARIERVEVIDGAKVATMGFTGLTDDARQRLLNFLER
ncbi:MAG: hypothetical protein EXR71_15340 [Myxococcales bacterium]|nr:hypothetical protein [Myxococcales bacterium]